MREWTKGIQEKNYIWSKVMQEYKQNIIIESEKISKERVKCMIMEMIYKHHPMLRTISKKGVFSREENINDSEIEKLIRSLYTQINKNKLNAL